MDEREKLERSMDLLRRIDQQDRDGYLYGGALRKKVREFLVETEKDGLTGPSHRYCSANRCQHGHWRYCAHPANVKRAIAETSAAS